MECLYRRSSLFGLQRCWLEFGLFAQSSDPFTVNAIDISAPGIHRQDPETP